RQQAGSILPPATREAPPHRLAPALSPKLWNALPRAMKPPAGFAAPAGKCASVGTRWPLDRPQYCRRNLQESRCPHALPPFVLLAAGTPAIGRRFAAADESSRKDESPRCSCRKN